MKNALITGAGRGIGKALAHKFLAEGWRVFGTTQTGTVDYSADYSSDCMRIFQLDLDSADSIKSCTKAIDVELGKAGKEKISILINNAGILADEGETHVVIGKLRKTLEVNLLGTIDFTEQIIPMMIGSDKNGSHIVNISSQAGSLAEAEILADTHEPYHYPSYKISKAALNMYTRTLAVRMSHEETNIIVSSIHPGWVRTAMGGDSAPVTPDKAAEDIFKLAVSSPETGQFWYKGKRYPW